MPRRSTLAALLLLALAACGDSEPTPVTPEPRPALIERTPADPITAEVGATVTLRARVVDDRAGPVPGMAVAWSAGAGSIVPNGGVTDADGVVTALWTLGTTVGEQTATATAGSLHPATFAARTHAGPVAEVTVVAPLDTIRTAETMRLSVETADRYGNPVTGASVVFSSSDEGVATVDSEGVVRGFGAGSALIAATSGGASSGVRVVVRAYRAARLIATGNSSSCVITVEDEAYCWGSNAWGAAGRGTSASGPHPTPEPVVGGHRFAALATDLLHACGITLGGDAYCWGQNRWGQLGVPDAPICELSGSALPCSTRPVAVAGGLRFRSISVSSGFSCAITTDDRAYCWGLNSSGQLGIGSKQTGVDPPVNTPTEVAGGHRFTAITTGASHTCALDRAGQAYCWGFNNSGQIGADVREALAPVRVSGRHAFRSITAGGNRSCALTHAGEAYCWGVIFFWELGVGDVFSTIEPRPIPGITFTSLETGEAHSCGLATSGGLYCWGSNDRGQVGIGTRGATVQGPTLVAPSGFYAAVSASGLRHTCAVTSVGQVDCWGHNLSGQLGTGTDEGSAVPTAVVGF